MKSLRNEIYPSFPDFQHQEQNNHLNEGNQDLGHHISLPRNENNLRTNNIHHQKSPSTSSSEPDIHPGFQNNLPQNIYHRNAQSFEVDYRPPLILDHDSSSEFKNYPSHRIYRPIAQKPGPNYRPPNLER